MRPHVCRTRNQSTSKESRLNKFDPVRREEGFANLRFALRLGSSTLACSQVCRLALRLRSSTLACSQVCRLALRLGSSTLACSQVCRLALRLGSSTLACSQVCRLALRLGSSTLACSQIKDLLARLCLVLDLTSKESHIRNRSTSYTYISISQWRSQHRVSPITKIRSISMSHTVQYICHYNVKQ
jgi:hypothetical protein